MRLLADAAHAQTAANPLLSTPAHEGGATAAARIARRRAECGVPPPVVSVAAGVLEGAVGLLDDDMFVELLDLMAVPWDPARRKQRRRQQQQRRGKEEGKRTQAQAV